MKYSCPTLPFHLFPERMGTGGNDRERANFQGAIAMNKSFSGAKPAIDLFGMAASPTKRTNDKPEAAALVEVLKALHISMMIVTTPLSTPHPPPSMIPATSPKVVLLIL